MSQVYTYSSKTIDQTDPILICQKKFSSVLGYRTALLLQRIQYWISRKKGGKFHDGKKWIYSTACELANQLGCSESSVRRSIKQLRDLEILLVDKLHSFKGNRTNFYTVNLKKLYEAVGEENPHTQEYYAEEAQPVHVTEPSCQSDMIFTNISSKTKITIFHAGEEKNSENEREENGQTLEKIFQNNKKSSWQRIKKTHEFSKTTQELIKIWNEEVEQEERTITLTHKRERFLMAAFVEKFDRSLEKWKQFCQLITKSDWLMGKIKNGFRAHIDWLLRFEIIQRILEGDFGLLRFIKNSETKKETLEEQEKKILTSSDPQKIKESKLKTLHALGVDSYISWFRDSSWEIDPCGLRLVTDSLFKVNYIENNFRNILKNLSITVYLKK